MKIGLCLALAIMALLGVLVAGCDDNDVANGIDNGVDNGVENGVDNDVPDVEGATSLQFTVEWSNGESGSWTYMAKDMGTEDLKLRFEGVFEGVEEGFIVNGELRTMWALEDGVWVDQEIPAEYWDMYWDMWAAPFEAYVGELYGWTGGEWGYTDPYTGLQVRIYDVAVNPDLPDALFEG